MSVFMNGIFGKLLTCSTILFSLVLMSSPAYAEDLSSLVKVTKSERSLTDRRTMTVTTTATVTITNSSTQSILNPVHAVFEISSPGVRVLDAIAPGAGNPYGKFYVNLSPKFANGVFSPSGAVSFTVRLVCPSTVRYSYKVLTFGSIQAVNHPPNANAGSNRTVTIPYGRNSVNVMLDGSGSVDTDGSITTYAWSGFPDPADLVQPSVTVGEGTYSFSLIATDDKGAVSPSASVEIKAVKEVVHPPQITVSAPPYQIAAGSSMPLAITVTATSPDGRPVALAAAPSVANASFNAVPGTSATASFAFRPDFRQSGNYLVTFTASDSYGLTSSATVQINVSKSNRPPVLTVQDSATVDEGGVLKIPVTASDPDGDILTVTATGLPLNAIFVPAAGAITFTPGYDQAGVYPVSISAGDGNLTVSKTVNITVNDVTGGGPGQVGALTLVVNPVESLTFLPTQRITGAVNAAGQVTPSQTSSLITGMSPTTGEQGATITVALTGDVGAYATHFAAGTSAGGFGEGITVKSLTVTGPSQASATIAIAPTATEGGRPVNVTTGSETAISVIAFNVVKGKARITGRVVDTDTNLPVTGATVLLQGTLFSATTATAGSFTFIDVPAGFLTLVVNAANHSLAALAVNAPPGTILNVGDLTVKSTVFDPAAPPTASLLSVIGRGATDPTTVKNIDSLKQVIRDALISVGGDEAGVLDEYGNQLNHGVTGNGMISLGSAGLNQMTERLVRGESMALQDILFALSYGMNWNGQPLKLDEWLSSLQTLVNQAWQDSNNSENTLPVLIFNKGKLLLPDPPTLSPHTRLNTLQGYLLVASLLTYVDSPTQSGNLSRSVLLAMLPGDSGVVNDADPIAFGIRSTLLADSTPPLAPGSSLSGQKPFTRFWRNFFSSKSDSIVLSVQEELSYAIASIAINNVIATNGIVGASVAALNFGTMYDNLNAVLINAGAAQAVPLSPTITKVDLITQADATQVAIIAFSPSKSETNGDPRKFIYSLYRFQGDEAPTLIGRLDDSREANQFIDTSPAQGTGFYTMTVTRYTANSAMMSQETQSWWPLMFSGASNVFALGSSRMTSDYSAPRSVYVGPIDFSVTLDGIAVDPDPDTDAIYYSDAGAGNLYKVDAGGTGGRTLFAQAGFKRSIRDGRDIVQAGLAIDSQGNLYCDNADSDEEFGGRIFKFAQPNGARTFTGTINYFSQMLMFANPTLSGPMVIRKNQSQTQEDLFIVDNMTMQIKAIPVNQTWDPYRRVGQIYATIPAGGVGRVIDMEFDQGGSLLVLDGWRVLKFDNGVPSTEALFTPE